MKKSVECKQELTNGVVTTCVVVGSILLATDHLLGVEELAIGTSADLIWVKKIYTNEKTSCNSILKEPRSWFREGVGGD